MQNEDLEEHRYLFTVRQRFNETPVTDCFYELTVPVGLTSEQAQIMKRLKEDFIQKEMDDDTAALTGMELRLRFNHDIFQHVCLVRTTCPITSEDMDCIIQTKFEDGELKDFLDESAIN